MEKDILKSTSLIKDTQENENIYIKIEINKENMNLESNIDNPNIIISLLAEVIRITAKNNV